MNKHAYWAWAIKNCTVVICCTALAITFDKWWIILCAGFFLSDIKASPINRYYRTCDGCGERSPYAETPETALKLAKEAGWEHYESADTDYCPKCQVKRGNNND